jgi:hypothetical protein
MEHWDYGGITEREGRYSFESGVMGSTIAKTQRKQDAAAWGQEGEADIAGRWHDTKAAVPTLEGSDCPVPGDAGGKLLGC